MQVVHSVEEMLTMVDVVFLGTYMYPNFFGDHANRRFLLLLAFSVANLTPL